MIAEILANIESPEGKVGIGLIVGDGGLVVNQEAALAKLLDDALLESILKLVKVEPWPEFGPYKEGCEEAVRTGWNGALDAVLEMLGLAKEVDEHVHEDTQHSDQDGHDGGNVAGTADPAGGEDAPA